METRKEQPTQLAGRIELAVALAATLASVWLHWIFLRHAGGLWRDEAGGVGVATLRSLGEMWQMLPHGGFPVFFPMLVRAWTALGLGDDSGLRLLGFLIGLSVLAALWSNARIMGYRIPLLALGLLGTNVTVVRAGDSLRAYGCGSLFAMLSLGLIWSLMRTPNWKKYLVASLVGVVSVQCLYQNAFLLLAVCGSAAFVCLLRQRRRSALIVLAAGLPAALSLVPYIEPVRQSQSWWILSQAAVDGKTVWNNLSSALATPEDWETCIWIGFFLLTLAAGVVALLKRKADAGITENDLTLFAATACVAGCLAFFIFIWLAQLNAAWHFVPLITFVAACMDAAMSHWLQRHRIPLILLVGLLICILFPGKAEVVKCRMTNLDLIASQLQKHAAPDDFIIVYPWYFGVSFGRYYQGQTPWTTLPALSDHRFHRYDLMKEKMQATAPIEPLRAHAVATLASGHRLWLVGGLPGPPPGETRVPELPPAPNGPSGWFEASYGYVWARQLAQSLVTNAGEIELVSVPSATEIDSDEDPKLFVVAGWRSPTPTAAPN